MVVSEKMYQLGTQRSAIRDLFEYGRKRAAEVGAENVYDFSLGNPTVPAPECVNAAIRELTETVDSVGLHGYTSAQGDAAARQAVAEYLNRTHGTQYTENDLYITMGAAASLSLCFGALTTCGEDEFIAIAPFFPEYRVFVEAAGAQFAVVPADTGSFQIDFVSLEKLVGPHTKGVIINSPNNPSGAVYSEETIRRLAALLTEKSKEYGTTIFLVADEPYREIAYDGIQVPFVPLYYDNTLVCYSYSKSLSLPGERIGYVLVPKAVKDSREVYAAIAGAGRALGYVCAPSLFQRVIAQCMGETGDIEIYRANRDLLYEGLTGIGYECFLPQGAFYLFMKALEPDADAFCERAKEQNLLIVPGTSFGCPGYVRVSYCVEPDMIRRSFAAFERLYGMYQNRNGESRN